jgi:hypothetical protein
MSALLVGKVSTGGIIGEISPLNQNQIFVGFIFVDRSYHYGARFSRMVGKQEV